MARAVYVLRGKVVGERLFDADGQLELERGLRDGQQHGMEYQWHSNGALLSAEPWVDGRIHGTSRQWDRHGHLIGSYTIEDGTGVDLWWSGDYPDQYLSEVVHWKEGQLHGFEWRITEDQSAVWWERHWWCGLLHGIERMWSSEGKLSRGYPRYYVQGQQVDKRKYLRAMASDPSLPRFHLDDNRPRRKFPPEIERAMSRS